jgi:dienelactone hydrolase
MAEKKVAYQVGGRHFEGMIVYDESVTSKRPVIFMQPDWKGVCADTIGQAHIVAGKDYVVLMADMFGAGYGDKPKTRKNWRQACWLFIMIWLSPLRAAIEGTAFCWPRR